MVNRNFSLTHPVPGPPARPRNDGRDYASEAVSHLLNVAHSNLDFEDAYAELSTVSQRLQAGDLWLRERGPTNPKYGQAQRQHATLSRRQGALLQIVKARYVALYLRCADLHGCLNSLSAGEQQAWLGKHAGHAFTNDLASIWRSQQPERKMPFTTLAPPEAMHIDGGFRTPEQLENWMTRGEESTL